MGNEKNELASEATMSLDKTATAAETSTAEPIKKVRLRAFPIWLRLIVLLLVLVLVAIGGVMIGYSVLGGGEAGDALKVETWKHIFDIMNGKE